MKLGGVRVPDWHGIERIYRRGDAVASRLRELVPRDARWLDRDGVLAAWGEREDPAATIVRGVERVVGVGVGIERVGGGNARVGGGEGPIVSVGNERVGGGEPPIVGDGDGAARRWAVTFEHAVAAIARRATAPVVALGGGLDGAAVLKAWRAAGIAMPAVATIVTGLAGYDEIDAAMAIAARYGCRCDAISVTPEAIVRAIPDAAAIGETPLYNLHPVARLVLARGVAARGHDVLVTGDGGDAVFAGVPDHDYVPIVCAYTRAFLQHASPYVDPAVIAATPVDRNRQGRDERHARDPRDRRVLRDYVADERPKRPRMLPAIAIDAMVDRVRIESLAREIDLPPAADVRWVTLDYLVRDLGRGRRDVERERDVDRDRREVGR